MSIYRKSGLVFKPSGLFHNILQQLKQVDLRPVQKIEYTFDPFHRSSKDVRNFMYYFSAPKIRDTNYKCAFKTNIVSDNSEPEIQCQLDNGKTVVFKSSNLTLLEILQQFNQIVHPLIPPPEVSAPAPKTKSQKKKK